MSSFGDRFARQQAAAPAAPAALAAPAAPAAPVAPAAPQGGFSGRAPGGPPPGPSRNRYAGVRCSETRDPMLGLGTYRVRVVACAKGYNPAKRRESFKTTLYVVESAPGSQTAAKATVGVVFLDSDAGIAETKRFIMHAAGFGPTLDEREAGQGKEILQAAEDKFREFEVNQFGYEGVIAAASTGETNQAPSIVGRVVDVIVTRGKDVPNPQSGSSTGDFFRVYTWGVVPQEEQTPA